MHSWILHGGEYVYDIYTNTEYQNNRRKIHFCHQGKTTLYLKKMSLFKYVNEIRNAAYEKLSAEGFCRRQQWNLMHLWGWKTFFCAQEKWLIQETGTSSMYITSTYKHACFQVLLQVCLSTHHDVSFIIQIQHSSKTCCYENCLTRGFVSGNKLEFLFCFQHMFDSTVDARDTGAGTSLS